jgi:hypothetical protein
MNGDEVIKLIKTVGTGMTRRGVVAFDWDEPGDADAQIAAAIETFNRSSFIRLSRRLAGFATGILDSAGLPSDPEKGYEVTSEGTWATVDWPVIDEDAELDDECETSKGPLSLSMAVEASGYAEDSPQGYAAKVLLHLADARMHLRTGNHDGAMALAFALGGLVTEAGIKEEFEQDVDVGERVREGGRQASVKTHGTEAERDARHEAYVEAFDKLVAMGASHMTAYRAAGKLHRVSPRTIRRAVSARKRKA